jgi:hypothetical protein
MLRGYQVQVGGLSARHFHWVQDDLAGVCGGRVRSGAAAAPHAGKSLPAHTLALPRRLRDACVRHVPGAQVRSMCGSATRITMGVVAATNRRARFPAAQSSGVLRIASAADLARSAAVPPAHRRYASRSPRPRTRVTREAVKRGRSVTAALGTGDPARVAEDDAETAAFPRDVRGSKNEMRGVGVPVSND